VPRSMPITFPISRSGKGMQLKIQALQSNQLSLISTRKVRLNRSIYADGVNLSDPVL
jgi:hypothetical protein